MMVKGGKHASGSRRLRCKVCGKYLVEEIVKPIRDMRIELKDAIMALSLLLEGMSIRAVERLTGLHRDTIDDLILVVGENCGRLLKSKLVAVEAKDVRLDEIWSFIGCKEKTHVREGHDSEVGDSWTIIAIDRDTKLVPTHAIGQRDIATSTRFLNQLDRATTGRFQFSSDGLGSYTLNEPFVFGSRVEFAPLIKNIQNTQTTVRYSPAKISSCEKTHRFGNPDMDRVCTSHVERLNLTLRMNMRRFTRLTNGQSKSLKHHVAMQNLFFAWYNWSRKHASLKVRTPAMAAERADKAWTIRELLETTAAE